MERFGQAQGADPPLRKWRAAKRRWAQEDEEGHKAMVTGVKAGAEELQRYEDELKAYKQAQKTYRDSCKEYERQTDVEALVEKRINAWQASKLDAGEGWP